ncbi:MAG: class I SAM-dependent methyltransferase family protein [Candidatus Aenigmarchaeota archaeon]|nr:class I SAM-dependent methyltransferase family protein [Candidatus Aenigmarchaeota archaeon]
MALRDLLKGKLTKKQLRHVPSSFDIIGNREKAVAIIEVPKELRQKARAIAAALMKQHKNVKSVLEKASERKGIYRLRKMKIIAGSRNTEVVHNEAGCRFLLDPRKVYFSPREGTERLRMAGQVKEKETVMVFFAGAGTFPVIIGKRARPSKVIGIEINPDACRYFWKDIKLNKLENIQIVLGDVKEKSSRFAGTCDRVMMPLPEKGQNYLGEALTCLKKRGFVHLYAFANEDEIKDFSKSVIGTVKKTRKQSKIISINKVLPYGPGIWKYRIDIRVS